MISTMRKPGEAEQKPQEGILQTDAPLALNLFGFVGDSIVDGPGLRCVVFCQGCPHACPGCHNPGSHAFGGGEKTTVDEVYRRIQRYPLCKAVTFSGGEPFCQAEAMAALARRLKEDGKELAAYTGYTFEALLKGSPARQKLLSLLDTLIDGCFVQEQRNLNLRFRGSENQRILNVPKSLAAGTAVWETAARWVGTTIDAALKVAEAEALSGVPRSDFRQMTAEKRKLISDNTKEPQGV